MSQVKQNSTLLPSKFCETVLLSGKRKVWKTTDLGKWNFSSEIDDEHRKRGSAEAWEVEEEEDHVLSLTTSMAWRGLTQKHILLI